MHQRRKMFGAFLQAFNPSDADSVLDVGVTGDQDHHHTNYFEALYPHKSRVTATGLEDASFLERLYPGMRFVQADGLDLPFPDRSYDYVHSSAVIEHVGSSERQATFLRELWRVARGGIFVTTPNRWFPVEFHTILPVIHYLPPKAFRACLRALGNEFFADEANLNLMSRASLWRAAQAAGLESFEIQTVPLAGWPSNLLLIARRPRLA
jgi:ubiquinone/menaquinone biosynthesis C-methylase UbiE